MSLLSNYVCTMLYCCAATARQITKRRAVSKGSVAVVVRDEEFEGVCLRAGVKNNQIACNPPTTTAGAAAAAAAAAARSKLAIVFSTTTPDWNK
jgi:hypothetical protein